jgi:hypothetical protein
MELVRYYFPIELASTFILFSDFSILNTRSLLRQSKPLFGPRVMTAKLTTRPTPLFPVAHELGHLMTDESGPFLEEEAFGG